MKKKNFMLIRFVMPLLAILCIFSNASAQTRTVSGHVTGKNGEALAGTTVTIKGSKLATQSDGDGNFSFSNAPSGNLILTVTYVGYLDKEVKLSSSENRVNVILEETSYSADDVVVTGAFDRRKRMDASVAISTLSTQQLQKLVPNSASDLLKNVPGVYVNSSAGEIRNTVSSRGITAGTGDGSFGYEYVSMQEDGLPVTNSTYFSYGPDFFLRPDATLERVDAVRGGTASIAAANAPGGIFNYISKTGGNAFDGEVRLKYGLMGNGSKSQGRADADFGGPMGKGWFYNVGGFYRYDDGARYAGYPMNEGGQVKSNLVKKYAKGSVKIIGKYLNDKNSFAQPIPTLGYSDPHFPEGFNNNSTVLPPEFQYDIPDLINGGTIHFNSKNLVKSEYASGGVVWNHDFGNGWSLTNGGRFSDNHTLYNTAGGVITSSLLDPTTEYLLSGFVFGYPSGTFSFKNANTGQEVATLTTGLDPTTFQPVILGYTSNLPGNAVSPDSYFVTPLSFYKNHVTEFLDQFTLNKKIKNMNFTLGGYYGYTNARRYSGGDVAISTIKDRPQLLTLSFNGTPLYGVDPSTGLPILGAAGTYQLTNNVGVGQLQGNQGAYIYFSAKQNQHALFFAHTWNISNALTFDWGVRYENVNIKGLNRRPYLNALTGGNDGDVFTKYNNNAVDSIGDYRFNYTINTFSFSGALNYKLSDNFAVYGRYSQGKKAPDLDFYFTLNTPQNLALYRPKVRTTQQVELGLKAKTNNSSTIFFTPFYSLLSGVPIGAIFQDTDGTFYFPRSNYARYGTFGVEIEANVNIVDHFSVRATGTLQKSKLISYDVWVANNPGRDDDSIVSYSGKEADNVPRVMASIAPAYSTNKFYATLTWYYMGSRQANAANVFKLPGFSQFDFSAGYTFSKHFQLLVNVNNLFNEYGVMSWQRPGGIAQVLAGNSSFSKTEYEAAVKNNIPYSTIGIQPRAIFVTAVVKL